MDRMLGDLRSRAQNDSSVRWQCCFLRKLQFHPFTCPNYLADELVPIYLLRHSLKTTPRLIFDPSSAIGCNDRAQATTVALMEWI